MTTTMYYVGTKSDLRQIEITPSIYPCPASGLAVPSFRLWSLSQLPSVTSSFNNYKLCLGRLAVLYFKKIITCLGFFTGPRSACHSAESLFMNIKAWGPL